MPAGYLHLDPSNPTAPALTSPSSPDLSLAPSTPASFPASSALSGGSGTSITRPAPPSPSPHRTFFSTPPPPAPSPPEVVPASRTVPAAPASAPTPTPPAPRTSQPLQPGPQARPVLRFRHQTRCPLPTPLAHFTALEPASPAPPSTGPAKRKVRKRAVGNGALSSGPGAALQLRWRCGSRSRDTRASGLAQHHPALTLTCRLTTWPPRPAVPAPDRLPRRPRANGKGPLRVQALLPLEDSPPCPGRAPGPRTARRRGAEGARPAPGPLPGCGAGSSAAPGAPGPRPRGGLGPATPRTLLALAR